MKISKSFVAFGIDQFIQYRYIWGSWEERLLDDQAYEHIFLFKSFVILVENEFWILLGVARKHNTQSSWSNHEQSSTHTPPAPTSPTSNNSRWRTNGAKYGASFLSPESDISSEEMDQRAGAAPAATSVPIRRGDRLELPQRYEAIDIDLSQVSWPNTPRTNTSMARWPAANFPPYFPARRSTLLKPKAMSERCTLLKT